MVNNKIVKKQKIKFSSYIFSRIKFVILLFQNYIFDLNVNFRKPFPIKTIGSPNLEKTVTMALLASISKSINVSYKSPLRTPTKIIPNVYVSVVQDLSNLP